MKSVRILLLEDNLMDAELLRATLEAAELRCDILWVDTECGFRTALDGDHLDLVISDYTLPSFDGKKAFAMAKERQPNVPFIFVSGTIGEDAAIESLLGGATDYVLKHKFSRLVPAVQRALKEAEIRNARREAEHQLQITLEQLRNLFDNLDDVFFSFDSRSQKLLQISPACERVYGLPQQAFFDNPQLLKQATHPDDRSTVEAAQAGLYAGRAISYECRICKPDGVIRWVQIKMKAASNPIGRINRIDGIVSDITERKELEEQLRHSQRIEAVGRVAGGVAHDFNNMLTVIDGYSELVLKELAQDNSNRPYIEQIKSAGGKAQALVRQLLAFSRNQVPEPRVLNINDTVKSSSKMLGGVLGEDIELVMGLDPKLGPVRADPGQLEQVLINLALNSRDAMPHGGKLTIETREVPLDETCSGRNIGIKPGNWVMLTVSDTGTGMDATTLSRIFEPFFTTKELGRGSGLGLSIVYGMIRQSGGHIRVHSEPGMGTIFTIYLPRTQEQPRAEEAAHAGAPNESPSGSEVILIVEDEKVVREFTRTILEGAGYKIMEAKNGNDALELFQQKKSEISLVLTDMVMPGMGGLALAEKLKQNQPAIKVICLSGYPNKVIFRHSDGSLPFIQKPYRAIELLQKVREILDRDLQAQGATNC